MSLTSVGGAPSSSVVAPPWLRDGRSRRSGALRRAQYHRAEARVIGKLLQHFAALQHRGCCATKLGGALVQALTPAAAAAAPLRPPGIFFSQDAAATAYAQPAYEAHPFEAPATTASAPPASSAAAQPAYAAPPAAAPTTTDAAPRTTPTTDWAMQPSILDEFIETFEGEIFKCGTGPVPRSGTYEQLQYAHARSAFEIIELAAPLAGYNQANCVCPTPSNVRLQGND